MIDHRKLCTLEFDTVLQTAALFKANQSTLRNIEEDIIRESI